MKVPLTLIALERLFAETERKATPHRTPDFRYIHSQVEGNPEVKGIIIFIEEHNTGYDGDLERWSFTIRETKNGKPLNFYADLLPRQVTTEEVYEP